MSHDPFQLVKAEVESSLQTATSLHSSYRRIQQTLPPSSHSSSEELSWTRDELKATLSALEADIEELEMSVEAVGRDPTRFGVTFDEVRQRQAFVGRVKDEVDNMRRAVSSGKSPQIAGASRFQSSSQASFHDFPPRSSIDNPTTDDDLDRAYAAQQQSLLYESQDKMLDGISGTVSTLKQQAGVMGREIFDQVGLLNDLESGIDASQSRLDRATKRMNEFIRKNKNSASSWTIFLLTIVLSFLLLAIILI